MTLKNTLCTILGIIGAEISHLFGGWTAGLTTLCIFMALDYITGIIVAGVFGNSNKTASGGLQSGVGFKGIVRKGVILAIVLVAHRLDLLVGTAYIKDAVVIAFCINEVISLIENAGLMGVPVPEVMIKAIDVLKGRNE